MHLKLIEPLRELFKDEVRQLGLALGLPEEIVLRHPFPGPGLGVRILGEINARIRRHAAPRRRHLHRGTAAAGYYDKVSQAFAVFLPVRSVGVVGDARRYDVRHRAARGGDDRFMTARLGTAALRADRPRVEPDHQRNRAASRGSSTTFRRNHPRRSSGNSGLSVGLGLHHVRWNLTRRLPLHGRHSHSILTRMQQMRSGVIVIAIMGLLAITATLLLKRASGHSTEKIDDLQRWEDDGGNLPSKVPIVEIHSA